MSNDNKKNGFIIQAGILAAAGILCRIIGLLYRSPLLRIIGDEGNGYYSTAYNIYSIVLLISSYSIPSAVAKVIAGRLAAREYRNAHRIFKCAMAYVLVIGGIASLFLFFGAGLIVTSNSIPVLRVLAPTIFLYGILGVLRGYFQAHGTMLQTSISQIVEQILNAAVSIGAAVLLIHMVIDADDTTRAIYGAAGSAIGTGVGVATAILIMAAMYLLNRKTIQKRVKRDRTRYVMSYREIFMLIMSVVTPFILSTFVYNLNTSLDQTLYLKLMSNVRDMTQKELATNYGILAKTVVVANIPIALSSAMSSAIMPGISACLVKGERRAMNEKVGSAIRTTMFISIPAAVGIGVLARPVMWFLFPQASSIDLASNLLRCLAVTVIFYALSTLTMAVLQGANKLKVPVVNAAIALVLQTIILIPLILYTNLDLYALVIANIAYSFIVCLLNGVSVKQVLGYRQEVDKTFFRPLVSAAVMGAAAYGVYTGMHLLTKSSLLALMFAIIVGVPVYLVLTIKWKAVGEEELRAIPKGYLLVKIAKKVHLMKS